MGMAMRGVARATADADLLALDLDVLESASWAGFPATVEVRRGDVEDPLIGVVRMRRAEEIDLDIVVPRGRWQRGVLDRAQAMPYEGGRLLVATPADLVLLKLDAGGTLDRWDAAHILETLDAGGAIRREVESRIGALPSDAQRLWEEIARGASPGRPQ